MQLREAADALGVHYQTAYGWVRHGLLPARKAGRGYEVLEADVHALAMRRAAGTPPRAQIRVRDWAAQSRRLYAALVAGDELAARRQVGRLADGVPLIDMCELVFGPALRQIGSDWSAGRVSIAVEHRASTICERLIAMRAQQPRGRPHGVAIVTTPPGERHGLPALMAAGCLRQDRWHVHHLASDLPVGEVIRLARDSQACLVVLSAATDDAARLAVEEAAEIRAAVPAVRVLTGAPGASLRDLISDARGVAAERAGAA